MDTILLQTLIKSFDKVQVRSKFIIFGYSFGLGNSVYRYHLGSETFEKEEVTSYYERIMPK